MSWLTLMILRPWRLAKRLSWGRRIMVPSRVISSPMAAAGGEGGEWAGAERGPGGAGAHQAAALGGAEGVDVARHDHVIGHGRGVGQDLDDAGPVGGGDAGGDAVTGIDGDGEGGAQLRPVKVASHPHLHFPRGLYPPP